MSRRKSEVENVLGYLEYVRPLEEWHYYNKVQPGRGNRTRLALFRCTYKGCGRLVKKIPAEVSSKVHVSCGCKKRERIITELNQTCNYAGKIVDRWQVIAQVGKKRGYALWRAICLESGKEIEISTEQISRGQCPCRCRQKRAMIVWGRGYRIRLRVEEELLLKEQRNADNASGNRGVTRSNRKATKIGSGDNA